MNRNELACVICRNDCKDYIDLLMWDCGRSLGAADRVLTYLKEQGWRSPDEWQTSLAEISNDLYHHNQESIKAAVEAERKILGIELERLFRVTDNRITRAWTIRDFIKILKEGKDVRT